MTSLPDPHQPLTPVQDEDDLTRPVVSTQRVWSGPIFTVDDDVVDLGGAGGQVRRQTVRHHDAVSVVALREGDASSQPDGGAEILMVRQYRHPVRADLWEIPAGLLDKPGEPEIDAARRELAEETDMRAGRWDVLADYFASPGFTTEAVRCFLARDLTPVPLEERVPRGEEEAEFVPTWFALDEVVDGVLAGRFHNPATVVGALATWRARAAGWEGLRAVDAPRLSSPERLEGRGC